MNFLSMHSNTKKIRYIFKYLAGRFENADIFEDADRFENAGIFAAMIVEHISTFYNFIAGCKFDKKNC